jgi:hypothetical protein
MDADRGTKQFEIKGFPKRCRIVEGCKGQLFINGYIEPITGDQQLLSVIERYVDRPAELPAQIPDLPGHYSLAYVTRDLKTAYFFTNRSSEPIYYSITDHGQLWSFAISDMLPAIYPRTIDEKG